MGDVVFGGVFGWGWFESKIFTGGGVRLSFFAAPAGAVTVVQCPVFSIGKDIMSAKILAIIAAEPAGSLPPVHRHSRLTIVRRGC